MDVSSPGRTAPTPLRPLARRPSSLGRAAGVAASGRWQDGEPPEPGRTVDRETATIQGEHSTDPLALAKADEHGISEIHRQVAVLLHQRANPGEVVDGHVE